MDPRTRTFIVLTLAAIAVAAISMFAQDRNMLDMWEGPVYDVRSRLALGTPTPNASIPIRIVAIDQKSLDHYGRWPWPRSTHARLIDRLSEAGARVIAFDVVFAEPSGPAGDALHPEDAALRDALERSKRVVLVRDMTNLDGRNVPGPLYKPIVEKAAAVGFSLVPRDPDGSVRAVQVTYGTLPERPMTLSVAMAEIHLNEPFDSGVLHPQKLTSSGRTLHLNDKGHLLVRPPKYEQISYVDVAEKPADKARFNGAVVLVCHTEEMRDRFNTPTYENLPGGMIHAAAFESIVAGTSIRPVTDSAVFGLTVLLLLGSSIVLYRMSFWRGLGVVSALAVGVLVLSHVLMMNQVRVDIVYPLAMLLILVAAIVTYESRRLRQAFQEFVPRTVVDELLTSSKPMDLGGKQIMGTVVFVDIAGYTTLSEKMPAKDVMNMVNRFHRALGEVFEKHKGTAMDYQGDAQMVVFGAPIEVPNHALAAVEASIDLFKALEVLNQELSKEFEALPEGVSVGVGIYSGELAMGVLGLKGRRQYTAIGDTTNMAARLEALTRTLKAKILIGESTYHMVEGKVQVKPHLGVTIKGKTEPQNVYEVLVD